MFLTILPTLLFIAALTASAIVLGAAWKSLLPAYRALRAQLDGTSEELVVNARVTMPAMRRRSFGPFRIVALPAADREVARATGKQSLRIQHA